MSRDSAFMDGSDGKKRCPDGPTVRGMALFPWKTFRALSRRFT